MHYISSTDGQDGIAAVTEQLIQALQENKKILWLVCGGSNIAAEVEIMNSIPDKPTGNLSVTLTDERYGDPGHKDSNWQQLQDAGFDFKRAKALPVLQSGKSLSEIVEAYDKLARQAVAENEIIVALFGIGADGHIAGILPDSPAANENEAWATGYKAGPLTRLTLTFPALRKISTAYALAFGTAKKGALDKLQAEDTTLANQPAQILKHLPEAYLYSDQIQGVAV